MKSIDKKTKAELIEIVKKLEEEISQLENDVDYWRAEYHIIEQERDEFDDRLSELEGNNLIKDVDNFISRLKIDNYNLFEKIEPFIENYLKFYNN